MIVLDGMQGGTAATQDVFIEHVGIPTLAAIRPAVRALKELDMHRKVQLIVSGGIRTGADVAKALALGADAVSIGVAALIALGDNAPELDAEYPKIGSTAGLLRRLARRHGSRRDLHAGRRFSAAPRPHPGPAPANYLAFSPSNARPSRGPTGSAMCTTWSRKTWWRSPSKPPP